MWEMLYNTKRTSITEENGGQSHQHLSIQTPFFHPIWMCQRIRICVRKGGLRHPPRQWDYAIKLVLGLEPKLSKVYLLSPVKQKELNSFLEENLHTGQIHPSKSPMTALVFFIKKKNGSLQLVQDYRALNSMTVKNKYPLLLISELVSQLYGAKYFTKLDVC